MKTYLILCLAVLVSSCNPAIAQPLDSIEIKVTEKPAMCQPKDLPPMPCALMFAMIQKIVGSGCGERTCPVKL